MTEILEIRLRARAEQGNINHPAYGTWTADCMLRQNESTSVLREVFERPARPPRSHCLRPGESTPFLIGHFPGGGYYLGWFDFFFSVSQFLLQV